MSSSTWERSSFFSSVLARELRLLWAPMYRVAYTGFVKLVGCGVKKMTRWLRQKKWNDLVYLLIQIGSARINNERFPSSVLKPWQTVVVCYVFCVWLFVSDKPVGVFPVKNFFLSTQDFMDNSSFDVLWLWWKVFEYRDHEGSTTKALFSCSPYSQCRSWHSPRDFCLQLGLNWRFFHFLGECKRKGIYTVPSYCAFICWTHSHTQR